MIERAVGRIGERLGDPPDRQPRQRKEVARDGVTVNALCPGIVGTGMWRGEDGLSGRWRQAGESEAQSWERHQASLLPQGEAQTVEDMGQLVVYLACAPHVTGQAIAVDGGFSL